MDREILVLRLGHRPDRDKRMSTHVGLVARAFGADGLLLDEEDEKVKNSIEDVRDRFGGEFFIETIDNWRRYLKDQSRVVIHLSMYGQRIQNIDDEIREFEEDILVVVGSQKVPGIVYEEADYNVAVTNQPHSEVAALAIFLDRLFLGKELEKKFDGEIEVIPNEEEKIVKEKD